MLRVLVLVLMLVAGPAAAQRAALAVLDAGAGPGDAIRLQQALTGAGFAATALRTATPDTLRRAVAALPGTGGERIALILTGRFVHSARGAWFLPGTAATGAVTLATVESVGINVATLAELAALTPGGAILVLGEVRGPAPGPGLSDGVGPAAWLPRGVALVHGPAERVAAFARGDLLRPGEALATLVARNPGLTLAGPGDVRLVPRAAPLPTPAEERAWAEAQAAGTEAAYAAFLARWPAGFRADEARAAIEALRADPAAAETALALTRDQRRAVQQALADLGFDPRGIDGVFGPGSRRALAAWQTARGLTPSGFLDRPQLDRLTAEAAAAVTAREAEDRRFWAETGAGRDAPALNAYLQRYPSGLFVALARERLAALAAAEGEARDRAEWDRAQAADTADAYRRYLNAFPRGAFARPARDRLAAIEAEAGDRAAFARAEAAGTQAGYLGYLRDYPRGLFAREADRAVAALAGSRQDRSAWDRARRGDSAEAYRAYLAAFPRGAFTAEAEARLAALATGEDDRAFARAERMDTPSAYRAYLDAFPQGRHAAAARARLAALEPPQDEVALDFGSRFLIEQMLATGGFRPGRVDGVFDDDTRAAIMRFQASVGLEPTGTITRALLDRIIGREQR
jgi:peptidoglycan hydrolase-like protein with peptidoglycan-binding domain